MEKRYETRSGDLFVRSWARVRRVSLDRRSSAGETDGVWLLLLLLSTPLHQRAASRVQHPKSCGSQQSLPPGGKERLHFVGIRPEVQARKGGW